MVAGIHIRLGRPRMIGEVERRDIERYHPRDGLCIGC